MVSEQHRANGTKGSIARWGRRAIAEGELCIGDSNILCYVLNSKERVISMPSLLKAFDMKSGGYRTGDKRIVRFLKTEGMAPHTSEELIELLNSPIEFKEQRTNRKKSGYPADVLPKLCTAIITAEAHGDLKKQQQHIAEQAKALLSGFATIGVIGLIDEATGYQYIRERNALATILEDFISKEAAMWVKTFPDDFYRHMFRLRGLEPGDLHKRPKSFAQFTHDIVYKRLAPNVVRELNKKNPKDPEGRRPNCHHSWLSKNKGYPALRHHLGRLEGFMIVSKNWSEFMKLVNRHLPVQPTVEEDENSDQQYV